MTRNIVILTVAIAVVLITGCISGTVRTVTGSQTLKTRNFDFSDFNRVEVGSTFEVHVTRANSYLVNITLNDNLFDYLEVSKKGETLEISMKPGYLYLSTTQKAEIALPDLYALEISGATDGKLTGFSTSHPLQLAASGASSLEINELKAGNTDFNVSGTSKLKGGIEVATANFDVSGASTVELEGSATSMLIDAQGASTVSLADFPADSAVLKVSGASNAAVKVNGNMDVDVSGASKVTYSGNPELGSVQVSGGSTLRSEQE